MRLATQYGCQLPELVKVGSRFVGQLREQSVKLRETVVKERQSLRIQSVGGF